MRRSRPPAVEASPLTPTRVSPALAVTGFLMLVTIFLMANPWFGVKESVWPWEALVLGQSGALLEVILVTWVVTAFWCLLTAFTEARYLRGLVTTALAAVLLVECSGGGGGFVIEDYNFNNMLPMIALGAGFLLARREATRGVGTLLAGAGGALLIWALAIGFTNSTSRLESYFTDMGIVLADPGHEFPEMLHHFWWNLLPQTLVLVAAALGLLAACGLRHRHVLRAAFIILLAGIVLPMAVGVTLTIKESAGARDILGQVTNNMVGHGLMLWMLGVFALSDLVLSRAEAA